MQTVIVNKVELLEALRNNRALHQDEYNSAVEGWWQQVQDWFVEQQETIDMANEDPVAEHEPALHCPHTKPTEHLKDYDREIKMVEMSLSDEIELKTEEFGRYVMDEWDWSDMWKLSNTRYT
jgi:hypothetical protein